MSKWGAAWDRWICIWIILAPPTLYHNIWTMCLMPSGPHIQYYG